MISHIDHLVMTTRSFKKCIEFYSEILGMKVETFNGGRKALVFGQQKINLHKYGHKIAPNAYLPVPGSLDICLISLNPLGEIEATLEQNLIKVEIGPVKRTGAQGEIESIYVRDPDLNFI
ncbi:VOC family protein [Rosenbergiella epipactidis]|uniref:VOC family protein n=1 Tax=Rosenbergiella epipactidis TaxID=1544694 RepID=UPI001F4D9F0A|nr:VOC family protein [Rosenbergiella epipactidis]